MTPLLIDHVEFRIHAAICALLVLKLLLHAFAVGGARFVRKSWATNEDAKLLGGSIERDSLVDRLRAAHMNALENELPYIGIGLLFVLVGTPTIGIQAYGYTFLVARVVHSIAYVFGLQPFRTLAFGVGALCLVGMCVQVLMAAFA